MWSSVVKRRSAKYYTVVREAHQWRRVTASTSRGLPVFHSIPHSSCDRNRRDRRRSFSRSRWSHVSRRQDMSFWSNYCRNSRGREFDAIQLSTVAIFWIYYGKHGERDSDPSVHETHAAMSLWCRKKRQSLLTRLPTVQLTYNKSTSLSPSLPPLSFFFSFFLSLSLSPL